MLTMQGCNINGTKAVGMMSSEGWCRQAFEVRYCLGCVCRGVGWLGKDQGVCWLPLVHAGVGSASSGGVWLTPLQGWVGHSNTEGSWVALPHGVVSSTSIGGVLAAPIAWGRGAGKHDGA